MSILQSIVTGETTDHLDMLCVNDIDYLLEYKWSTFAKVNFKKLKL
jgi:hypothetical protein